MWDDISIPLFCWGGSPRKILVANKTLSPEEVKFIISCEGCLYSDEASFGELLRSKEKNWVEFPPVQDGKHRFFLTSWLYEEPGIRPVWYFLCLFLDQEAWLSFNSYGEFL